MAQATGREDELIIADCDFEQCRLGRTTIFDFARHRRPEAYRRITDQVGVISPDVFTSR